MTDTGSNPPSKMDTRVRFHQTGVQIKGVKVTGVNKVTCIKVTGVQVTGIQVTGVKVTKCDKMLTITTIKNTKKNHNNWI